MRSELCTYEGLPAYQNSLFAVAHMKKPLNSGLVELKKTYTIRLVASW
jgi:hypothetical protein